MSLTRWLGHQVSGGVAWHDDDVAAPGKVPGHVVVQRNPPAIEHLLGAR
jgi:hypothetical protein